MIKVLFIDDRLSEIVEQWERSGSEFDYELLPLEKFISIERTCQIVVELKPDVLFIGYGLGKPGVSGSDVIRALKDQKYPGTIIANSGGGIIAFTNDGIICDDSADRNPQKIKTILDRKGDEMFEKMKMEVAQLKFLITAGMVKEAIELIDRAEQVNQWYVEEVFESQNPPIELINAVLEGYLRSRQNRRPYHGGWVHNLSHFTEKLWELRLTGWIKRFNEVAFKGAIELEDENCSERLIYNFAEYSRYNDKPKDFGITPENTVWMEPSKYNAYARTRIAAGAFHSQEAYETWKLQHKQ